MGKKKGHNKKKDKDKLILRKINNKVEEKIQRYKKGEYRKTRIR